MDRNTSVTSSAGTIGKVALRKESVDRNQVAVHFVGLSALSLSARRAWIEICQVCVFCRVAFVALRKESVDRNVHAQHLGVCVIQSLSARRAWIEMPIPALLL